ncbi:MAG: Precorrin-6B methylase 2 [Lachnospiraceae bacterium]|nr:Precorrin-6B methylase 2 [Lachnospiraceae bacterium]
MVDNVYTNKDMLAWLEKFSDKMDVSPEKIKILNICTKKKNVLPTIETHKRVMIFANETYQDILFEFWEAGFGEYDIWLGEGECGEADITHTKVKDVLNRKIQCPTVIFIVNENTRESYRVGIKNEFFSAGTVRYVGNEIRAVIMSMLATDVQDTICIVSGESIVVETAIAASEGTVIAVEKDKGSMRTMRDNVGQFGVHNVEIIPNLSSENLSRLPVPRLAFIVATSELEDDIKNLLSRNPKMQFLIYTLEFDILTDIKNIFEKYNITKTGAVQISISKTDKNSVLVTEPSPWIVSGEVE